MNNYYYVYVLISKKDNNYYIGFTKNISRRLIEHNKGKVFSTKNRRPMILVYWEGCLNQTDATNREKYLKTSWGKRYIKNRIKNYLIG
jgi:putative endonuclease